MGYARYVGRVGALAVALGIGAVANTPAVGWADDGEGSSSGSSSSSSSDSGASSDSSGSSSADTAGGASGAASGSTSQGADEGSSTSDDTGDDDAVGQVDSDEGSGGQQPTAEDAEPSEDPEPVEQPDYIAPDKPASEAPTTSGDSQRQTAARKQDSDDTPQSTVSADSTATGTSAPAVNADPVMADVFIGTLAVHSTDTEFAADDSAPLASLQSLDVAATATPAPAEAITGLMSWLALNPLLGGGPTDTPDSPFAWAVFAALRRLIEEDAGAEQQLVSVADPVVSTLSVEDAAAPTTVYELDSSIPVGSGPTGLAVTPDGGHVYVADRFTKSVWVIDTSTRAVVATIPMGAGPNHVAFSPDGSRAYVGLHGINQVAVIDTATNTIIGSVKVGPGATETVVTPDGKRAYVTNTSGRTASVIDTETNTEIARVAVGSSPMGLAVTPDGSRVYVANRYSNSVSVIDTATNTVVSTVKVGSSPRAVAITPDPDGPGGSPAYAYVTNAGPDTVSVIDTTTNTVVATVRVGRDPIGVAMSPDGALVYAVNSNDTVSVIDTATNTVVDTFSVDPNPETGVHYIAVGPDGTVYVTDTRDKMLRVVTSTSSAADVSTLSGQEATEPMALAMATAAVNAGPSASPTAGAPDTVTGKVTGSLNAVDPDGNPLTYSVQSKTTGTAVTVDGSGNFTYTPSAAMRAQAATTPALDSDTFTVRVSDGRTFTDVPVTVVVRPGQLVGGASIDVDKDPSGVAFNADGSRAYVTNQYTKTVSVIDTSNGAVLSTIKVPYSPKAVVVSPTTNRAYVAMTSGVAVIDTTTNTVVDLNPGTSTVDVIKVGASPSAIAINPSGSRLYVSNGGSSTVSVIDTATNKEITKVTVGSQPSGLAVSPDGTRVYALSRYNDKVTVFSTATNQVIGTATVGDSPRGIVLSPNGQVAYVTNYNSGTVTVLNTSAATPIFSKTITVGTQPEGIAMSQDGTLVYVANGRDTVSVIDTRTNAVVGSPIPVDSPAESGAHAIAVSGNKVYVTDYVDDWVRVLNVASVQSPPVLSTPMVGTPNRETGTVSGSFTATDDDTVQYTNTQGGKGTVVVSQGAYQAGVTEFTFTYTPTQGAREEAAETPGADVDTFTVTVSDGTTSTVRVVTVTVEPAQPAPTLDSITTPIGVGNPTNIAVVGDRAYVVSPDNGVYVIDTTTKQVIGAPIPVGYAPTRVVAGPDLDARPEVTDVKRVYVATYDTVSVIDTDPASATYNTVIADISVPNSCGECYNGVYDVVVRPDGKRIYAARGDGSISVIGTDPTESSTYHQVISTTSVGLWDGDLEITPDGSRLYVAHISADEVEVLDSETLATVARVPVGPRWDLDSMRSEMTDSTYNVAVSPDGSRAYVTERVFVVERGGGGQTSGFFISDPMGRSWLVTGGYSAVSVIDTDPASGSYNQEIARIVVPDDAYDVSVAPDGSRAYVTHRDGTTVTVIDTETNTVIGTFSTDQAGGSFHHRTVAVGSDGTLYITDPADNKVYASTVGDDITL